MTTTSTSTSNGVRRFVEPLTHENWPTFVPFFSAYLGGEDLIHVLTPTSAAANAGIVAVAGVPAPPNHITANGRHYPFNPPGDLTHTFPGTQVENARVNYLFFGHVDETLRTEMSSSPTAFALFNFRALESAVSRVTRHRRCRATLESFRNAYPDHELLNTVLNFQTQKDKFIAGLSDHFAFSRGRLSDGGFTTLHDLFTAVRDEASNIHLDTLIQAESAANGLDTQPTLTPRILTASSFPTPSTLVSQATYRPANRQRQNPRFNTNRGRVGPMPRSQPISRRLQHQAGPSRPGPSSRTNHNNNNGNPSPATQSNSVVCYRCGSSSHFVRNCPVPGPQQQPQFQNQPPRLRAHLTSIPDDHDGAEQHDEVAADVDGAYEDDSWILEDITDHDDE
ncbi:hypothetical protein HDU76_010279, partial [Blyttiomyces sp. JEL0837]